MSIIFLSESMHRRRAKHFMKIVRYLHATVNRERGDGVSVDLCMLTFIGLAGNVTFVRAARSLGKR